jgi:hypothetical protein
MMRPQPDLSNYHEPEPATAGDTIVDVISGIVVMLAIISLGLNLVGVFG